MCDDRIGYECVGLLFCLRWCCVIKEGDCVDGVVVGGVFGVCFVGGVGWGCLGVGMLLWCRVWIDNRYYWFNDCYEGIGCWRCWYGVKGILCFCGIIEGGFCGLFDWVVGICCWVWVYSNFWCGCFKGCWYVVDKVIMV